VQTVKPVPALQVVQAVLCTFDRGFFVARPLQVCTHNAYITHKEKPIRRKAKGDALRKTDWTAPVLCVRTLPLLLLFVHSYLAVAALFVRTLPLLLCLYRSCSCCSPCMHLAFVAMYRSCCCCSPCTHLAFVAMFVQILLLLYCCYYLYTRSGCCQSSCATPRI